MNIEILFEDSDILVIDKPAGIPTQPDKSGDESVLDLLNTKGRDLRIVHRLDRTVSGVMVFAKNAYSAAELSRQIQEGIFVKKYLAVVCGKTEEEKTLENWLIKNERLNISKCVAANTPKAKEAKLRYKKIAETETAEGCLTLIEVELFTGRHHQIRVQLAANGTPIWGDTKYNDAFKRRKGFFTLALRAATLRFFHPKKQEALFFEVPQKLLIDF